MNIPFIEREGLNLLKDQYWVSFHVVKNGKWSTGKEAIINLSSLFPGGNILNKIVALKIIIIPLVFILKLMQSKRKLECRIIDV